MIIAHERSEHQHVLLQKDSTHGLYLTLDGMVQFTEVGEYQYHESLVVPPMAIVSAERVLVCGGGDGLAVARLLRYPCVREVVLVDYDPAVTRLARENSELVRLNEGSLNDPRVTVINADAFSWLEAHEGRFDLVICDFPDPWFPELGRLYSVEFYDIVRAHLSEGGLMVVQTRPVTGIADVVRATVAEVFDHSAFYLPLAETGYTLGRSTAIELREPIPGWTQFLDEAYVRASFHLSKDVAEALDPDTAQVNRAGEDTLVVAALAESSWSRVHPYPYRDGYFTMLVDGNGTLDERQCELLLRAAYRHGKVIVAIEDGVRGRADPLMSELGFRCTGKVYEHWYYPNNEATEARRRQLWERMDDGSVARVRAAWGPPGDDPDVQKLMSEYIEGYGDRFFDVAHSALDMDAPGNYAITRGPNGEPRALFKTLGQDPVDIEVMYGVGSARQNMLSLLLLLSSLTKHYVSQVDFWSPVDTHCRILRKIGGQRTGRYAIFVHPDSDEADSVP